MESVSFTIRGTSALIVNRFTEEESHQASDGRQPGSRRRPSPEEDARSRLYLLGDGELYFPAENLRQSLINAAGFHKIGRRSAKMAVAAGVLVEPEALTLKGDWSIDSRAVVIPATRGRILRNRPIFQSWEISGTLQYDEDLMGDDAFLHEILATAGQRVGLGDYRPQKYGPYGRFIVVEWKSAADEEPAPVVTAAMPKSHKAVTSSAAG